MVTTYTISVSNESGADQQYALFSKAPTITGRVQGQIWSNVFTVRPTPKQAMTDFRVFSQYYAIVGTSQGSPADGVAISVNGVRDITLGSTYPDGTAIPGTTLALKVTEKTPEFDGSPLPNTSYVNAFQINCGNDFTVSEAKKGHYLIGLGWSTTGDSKDGPATSFIPEPNVSYQIQPANVYHLTFGNYTKGAIIDINKIDTMATIEFNQFSSNVTIVHDGQNNLTIQAQ